MAVKLEKKTAANKVLKIVSVVDDAIDWKASFPSDDPEEQLDEAGKRNEYLKEHDSEKLVFRDGCAPTFFVFKHPRRADVQSAVRAMMMNASKVGTQVDGAVDLFNFTFLGTAEGFEGETVPPPRVNGKVSRDYFQMLEDANVLNELALRVLNLAQQDAPNDLDKKKS